MIGLSSRGRPCTAEASTLGGCAGCVPGDAAFAAFLTGTPLCA